jgi:F-type H+-transporting ATPase subunit epsilon
MAELNLEIVTPSSLAYSGKANVISIPGTLGGFQILFNHAPIISTFEVGLIKVELEKQPNLYFATGGGTVEVLKNKVRILADSIEKIENIDIDRARDAMERAQSRLENKDDKTDIDRAKAALKNMEMKKQHSLICKFYENPALNAGFFIFKYIYMILMLYTL